MLSMKPKIGGKQRSICEKDLLGKELTVGPVVSNFRINACRVSIFRWIGGPGCRSFTGSASVFRLGVLNACQWAATCFSSSFGPVADRSPNRLKSQECRTSTD